MTGSPSRGEPGNRHDPRAITVQWQSVMLGYVPRDANYALSQMMDREARAEARVKSLRAGGDPWQRVLIEVTVHAAASVPAPERPKEPEVHWIPAYAGMTPAELKLAYDAAFTPKQCETGLAVLRDCFPDVAARLSRAVMGVVHELTWRAYERSCSLLTSRKASRTAPRRHPCSRLGVVVQ
jgi:hypothetical protein